MKRRINFNTPLVDVVAKQAPVVKQGRILHVIVFFSL